MLFYNSKFLILLAISLHFPNHYEFADPPNEKANEKQEPKYIFKMGQFSRETPQQVHLSLTDQMDEMNISWLTFEEVVTFVEYWHEDAKRKKIREFAKMVKHQFRDFLKDRTGCNSEQKLFGNYRFFHTVTLKGLQDDSTYEYQVGHCDPKEIANECLPIIRQEQILQTNGVQEIQRDKVFFFRTFSKHSANKTFSIAIFGDMGLKRPEKHGVFEDQEGTTWKHADQIITLPDTLAPQAMESLMALVHPGHNDEHPIRKSHLNERSSGLRMTNVQLILHIGDIAYDMHEYRMKQKVRQDDEDEVYNLGDRFMQVVEDIAAYVPYMVVAGNHENEEKSADYHKGERKKASSERYEPQFEHYESRFQMPRNFKGHNTSQYYDFTYGPIWFICVSTEYYYSYTVRAPTFRWMPDWDNVIRQYTFIEQSLKHANQNRHKYPWVIALQHRPFYCTSISKVTCRFNKSHKHGLPSKDDSSKLVYGLEELFNRYNVDLVITGHEHTFELFPPIELVDGRPKVVPDKYWWEVQRDVRHIDEDNQELVDTRHVFTTFTDPVAPVYLIVGRPGNAEETEKLFPVPWLQRLKYYNRFSFTLLHFPFDVTETKSTLAIRQLDIETGDVPIEFFVEKTFANYEPEVLCAELDAIDRGDDSKYRMTLSNLTKKRVQKKRNAFTRRRRKVKGKKQSESPQNGTKQGERKKRREKRNDKKNDGSQTVGGMGERAVNTKELIREMLYVMNGMGHFEDENEKQQTIWRLRSQICKKTNRQRDQQQQMELIEKEKTPNNLQKKVIGREEKVIGREEKVIGREEKVIGREEKKGEKEIKPIERQEIQIGEEMIKQIELKMKKTGKGSINTHKQSLGKKLTRKSGINEGEREQMNWEGKRKDDRDNGNDRDKSDNGNDRDMRDSDRDNSGLTGASAISSMSGEDEEEVISSYPYRMEQTVR